MKDIDKEQMINQIDQNTKRLDRIDSIFESMNQLNKLSVKAMSINKKSNFLLMHVLPCTMMIISAYLAASYSGEHKPIIIMMHLLVCSIFSLITFFNYHRRDKNVPRGTKGEK